LFAEVDEQDLHLAAVVGIDGARRVEQGDAVPQGQPRTRADLAFVAFRNRERDAGRDERSLARLERERSLQSRLEVETGGIRGLIGGKGRRGVADADDAYLDGLAHARCPSR